MARTTTATQVELTWRTCPTCWGQGRILEPAPDGGGLIPSICEGCLGTREVMSVRTGSPPPRRFP
jgi:DnaJ-class molecular chaperone